jgi:nucleoside-diphosphate-sugar epimerase
MIELTNPVSNLIIGDTSQLSFYFPKDYQKISSRNIDFDNVKKNRYNKAYLLFAEQRTFVDGSDEFDKINFEYTLEVIDNLLEVCENIVIYSTAELWNRYNGEVSINLPYSFNSTPYIESKKRLCDFINNNRQKYKKVIIIYPFNFNSIYRKEGFLFGKIYDSLINNKKIVIGDVDFFRDIIHPKTIVDVSINAKSDIIIGSGELTHIKTFIKDLYVLWNKHFEECVIIDNKHNLKNKRSNYYNSIKYSSYKELLDLSLKDLKNHIITQTQKEII